MHDHGIDGGLLQKHDIAGEFAGQIFRAHGVAAVFDDDDFLIVALHIGQGFREDAGLHLGAYGGRWCSSAWCSRRSAQSI